MPDRSEVLTELTREVQGAALCLATAQGSLAKCCRHLEAVSKLVAVLAEGKPTIEPIRPVPMAKLKLGQTVKIIARDSEFFSRIGKVVCLSISAGSGAVNFDETNEAVWLLATSCELVEDVAGGVKPTIALPEVLAPSLLAESDAVHQGFDSAEYGPKLDQEVAARLGRVFRGAKDGLHRRPVAIDCESTARPSGSDD